MGTVFGVRLILLYRSPSDKFVSICLWFFVWKSKVVVVGNLLNYTPIDTSIPRNFMAKKYFRPGLDGQKLL